ncbi:MAG: hypothetical protein Q7R56_01155 [Nanoarchaeota archaeon]|nr:hypothetical protein [Nanoarchaeota archaeon]
MTETEVVSERFFEIIKLPFHNADVFWTIVPLLVAAVGMQIYFGRNRTEELGWNTAFGNSITFTFVTASLVRYFVTSYMWDDLFYPSLAFDKLVILGIFLVIGSYLIFGNYFHSLPKHFSFLISSSIVINGFAIMAVMLIQSSLPLEFPTFVAAGILFFGLVIIEWFIKRSIRPSAEAQVIIAFEHARNEELRKMKQALRKRLRTARWNRFKQRCSQLFGYKWEK